MEFFSILWLFLERRTHNFHIITYQRDFEAESRNSILNLGTNITF